MPYVPIVADKETQMDVYSKLLKERIIILSGEITDENINLYIAELLLLANQSNEDIYLYINSPGGSVLAGLALYDTMNYIKPHVNTICIGLAASMGAFLLSAGKKRYALENSEIMIHEPSSGFKGNASEIFNQTNWLLKMKKKVDAILASNTHHSIAEIEHATKIDNYMSAEEALSFGIIDEILK